MIVEGMHQLNTKQDYYLAMQLYPKSKWLHIFTDLLDGRMNWVQERQLLDTEPGVNDETHKVVTIPLTGGGTQRYQYTFMEDNACQMFALGFTLDEVNNIIANG